MMKNIKAFEEFNSSLREDKKITMNNLDWGKSTAERNANLDKYNSLETDKEKNAFLKKLKSESIVSEAKENQAFQNLKAMKQYGEIKDFKVSNKGLVTIELNNKTLISFTNNNDFSILKKLKSESIVSEAKELVWLDKGDPDKEVRVTDDGGYVTIMQKDFEGRVIRVLIDTNQIPQLIAALKKAK